MLTSSEFFQLGKLACEHQCADVLGWLIETEVLAGRIHSSQDVLYLAAVAVREGFVFVLEWLEEHSLLQCDTLILRAIEHHQVDSLLFLLRHGGSPTVRRLETL
jgi:hypothetical protein